MKQLYCFLELSEVDNTLSCGRQWKSIFISYLTYLLQHNYQISLQITPDLYDQSEVEAGDLFFIHLKVLSRKNSFISVPKTISSSVRQYEFIGIIKEPMEFPIHDSTPIRFFDLCPIDPETNLPVKEEELFEQQFKDIFLSKMSDLAFEINHLFFPSSKKTCEMIYLAETTYELSSVRFAIKKELIKRGYQILPEKAFSIERSELIEQIRSDLKNSILSVHFFGNSFSMNHPQTNLQMEVLQNMVAADFYKEQSTLFLNGENTTYDFRRIIWFPENINVQHEKYLKYIDSIKHDPSLYAGADLIRSTPEALKDIIIQKLSGHSSKADAPPTSDFQENKIEISIPVENTRITVSCSVPQHTIEQYNKLNQENIFS